MKNKKIVNLSQFEKALETNSPINNIDTPNIMVIKRDGREEPYSINKMHRVLSWACDGNEFFVKEILEGVQFKLKDKIKIIELYDEVIKTAAQKISMLYPQYEYIAAKLFLLKMYKESGCKVGFYPKLKDVLLKGVHYKIYDKNIISSFSDEDLQELDNAIDQTRDFLFNYKSLTTFYNKYCINYSKNKKLELPQHAYMRVAIFLNWKEVEHRIEKIIETYNHISTHQYAVATPIMLRSLTMKPQTASCVLTVMPDDTNGIMDTIYNLALYSKYNGGTATDISSIRASGSYIKGNNGYSSGPVAYLKLIEATMNGYNQGGKRPGANCSYFPFWHYDWEKLIVLKSNGGTSETRCRTLKYAVKISNFYFDRVKEDKEITLFDPKDVPELLTTYGDEFIKWYEFYENKTGIRKKRMSAREHFYQLMKERTETGNIYIFFTDNVNENNILGRYINSSNLCTEVLIPARPSILKDEKLVTYEDGTTSTIIEKETGEIGLCNLASINLLEWYNRDDIDKFYYIYNLVRIMDNTIDYAYYPVKDAKYSNINYRYLGIGVNNYANLLASLGIKFQEALEFTDELFYKLSYNLIKASIELAKQRGKFNAFHNTLWAKGKLPVDFANKNAIKLTKNKYHDNYYWKDLREDISKYGIRNAYLMAIMPTATSGKALNATESIEPIMDLAYKEEGTFSVVTLAPNFRRNNKNYVKAFDCDPYKLIELAAVRQKYIDQSQSLNMYISKPDSLTELFKLHYYAMKLGIKTLYYFKQRKSTDEYICESCT